MGLSIVLSHSFRGLGMFRLACQEPICVSGFCVLGLSAIAFVIPTEMKIMHRDSSVITFIGCGMGGY
jgi:hypothetical protein